MKAKRLLRLISVSTVLSISLPVCAANLLQVYQQAVVSDPTFKQAQSTWMSDRENLAIAQAGFLPQIDIKANVDRAWNQRRPVIVVNTNGWFGQYGYGVTISQPIFDASVWASIAQAKSSVKAATATYLAAAQDLMVRTATAYLSVLQAYEQLRFTVANKRAIYRQLVTARQQFKVGLIAITGVYDAQSRYDQAQASEITDRNQLENTIEDLRAITGKHYLRLNTLGNRQVPLLTPKPNNINTWVRIANKHNYSLQASEYDVLAARQNISVQATGDMPVVTANAGYSRDHSFDHRNLSFNVDNQSANIGVALDFPVIQGGAVFAQTKQARYDYLTASGQLEFTHRSVVNSTRQSFLGVISGISQIKADKQAIKSARNALEATKAGYVVGTRTMVDVLNDLSDLYNAQRQYADDQYKYMLSIIQLKQAAGTLSVKDLAEINSWLPKQVNMPVSKAAFGDRAKGASMDTQDIDIDLRRRNMEEDIKLDSTDNDKTKSSDTKKDESKKDATKKQDDMNTSASSKKSKTPKTTVSSRSAVKASDKTFAVQVYAADNEAAAKHFLQKHQSVPQLALVKHDGLYKVIYGDYSDGSQATIALKSLPKELKKAKPWVLPLPATTKVLAANSTKKELTVEELGRHLTVLHLPVSR